MDKVYERKLMELFMDLFENRNNQFIVVTPKVTVKCVYAELYVKIFLNYSLMMKCYILHIVKVKFDFHK